jgi:hypothetical protein
MTVSRIETARAYLTKRYPDTAPTVDLVDGTSEWVLRYTGADGRRWSESLPARQYRGVPMAEMLRELDRLVDSRTRQAITDATADPPAPSGQAVDVASTGEVNPRLSNDYEFRASSYGRRYGVPSDFSAIRAMDYGVGTFTPRPRTLPTPDPTARIAAMSFAEYVAELHAALDPAGRGL